MKYRKKSTMLLQEISKIIKVIENTFGRKKTVVVIHHVKIVNTDNKANFGIQQEPIRIKS